MDAKSGHKENHIIMQLNAWFWNWITTVFLMLNDISISPNIKQIFYFENPFWKCNKIVHSVSIYFITRYVTFGIHYIYLTFQLAYIIILCIIKNIIHHFVVYSNIFVCTVYQILFSLHDVSACGHKNNTSTGCQSPPKPPLTYYLYFLMSTLLNLYLATV